MEHDDYYRLNYMSIIAALTEERDELRATVKALREALERIAVTGPPSWAYPKLSDGTTGATWAIARQALSTHSDTEEGT